MLMLMLMMTSQVRTYDVIPVSTSMGLMAFVAGTRQLMGAIAGVIDKAQISAAEGAYQRCAHCALVCKQHVQLTIKTV